MPIFKYLASKGVNEHEMFGTFNMGVGMVLVIDKSLVTKTIDSLISKGEDAYIIGEIKKGDANMPKIAVLISGGGSNLQSIIDAIENKQLNCEISIVIADREATGLNRAEKHGIKNLLVDKSIYKKQLTQEIFKNMPKDTDLIVLAGYLSILDGEITKEWPNKIINIHPSLLPKFGVRECME